MDALLSAVASDLVSRMISFLIRKYQERGGDTATYTVIRLQRALLRARIVVEEAEGRQVVNQAMLQQLIKLRRELCRATYALDSLMRRDADSSRRRGLHAKVSRFRSDTRPLSSDCSDVLPVMVESLEATLSNMRAFVVHLGSCPRITRQPYSSYLFMERCMFGRQMEKAEIISFLLRPSQDLDVLPIVGPREVGKRTLVEHVCLDERVRERFAKILRLNSDDVHIHDHEHHRSLFDFTARSLVLININVVNSDADYEELWRRFYSAVRSRVHGGSKIIVISRAEVHSSLGTVPPLRLRAPQQEELWYFFRALAFGATGPDERPDLVRIAMAMSEGMGDFAPFLGAGFTAMSLGTDMSARSWRRMRKMYAQTTVLQLDVPSNRFDEEKVGRYYPCEQMNDTPGYLFYNSRKLTGMTRSELPKVTMFEPLNGASHPPAEKTRFDVLVWQSRIPPYASYVATCDTDIAHYRQVVGLGPKTRLRNKRRRDHQEGGSRTLAYG